MKKTMLVLLLILLLVPAGLFAGIFNLSIGATAQYNGAVDVSEGIEWQDGFGEIENWSFGPDLRLRFLFVEVDSAALYSKVDDGHKLSGILTGGISLDLLGLVRVGVGMGPRMSLFVSEDGSEIEVHGPDGGVVGSDLGDAFMNAPMSYRATADLKLGKILLGVSYIIDSKGFTFAESDQFDKLEPDFGNGGTLGISLLYNLF